MQKRGDFFYVFFFFLLLTALVFFLSSFGFLNGTKSFVSGIFSPIQSLVFQISNLNLEDKRIKELEKENRELRLRIVDQSRLEKESKALRDQFETSYPKSLDLIPANIIGAPNYIPGISIPQSFILDKGEKDGIREGSAVVFESNLVGRVVKVFSNNSSVLLVTSLSFSFTAQSENGAAGVVRGGGDKKLLFDNVLLSESLKKDQLILTGANVENENLGFPSNIIVGKIISIEKKPSALFQRAVLESFLDFTKLTKVFILKN